MTPIRRRAAAVALLSGLAAPRAGRADRRQFGFDQAGGRIGFSARHLGLFASDGQFERFRATVEIDPDDIGTARVGATIETSYFSLPWPGVGDMLRGPRYFDVAQHPTAQFSGQAQGAVQDGAVVIPGRVRLRGIERPMTLLARASQPARQRGADTVSFSAAGELRRSDFGMTPDGTLISDLITLTVEVTLALGPSRR